MRVLAFDTCFSACSVAVRAGDEAIGPAASHELTPMDTGHAEALMPMVARVMEAAGIGFADLDRIVVTQGPGTFTGVRTGVAAARAFALATGAGLIGVSSLWAVGAAAARFASEAGCDAVLVAMDARKGEVYAQVIDIDGREQTSPLALDPAAAAMLCPGLRLMSAGSAADAVIAASRQAGRMIGRVPRDLDLPDARALLAAAARAPASGPLLPLYLRPPDAKPQADKSLPWSPA